MSKKEEEFYIDILKDDEKEEPKKEPETQWETPTYQQDQQQQYYKKEPEAQPYQQEFYGEGYYQDYQAQRKPAKEGRSSFWLGILIAVGISAVIMVIFNFTGASFHPGVAFLEMILLLACCTLPGLFVRKVGKGLLGGMMVFGLQFFIPLIIYYATGKDPNTFFNPYYLFLNALGLIINGYQDFTSFSFIPIDPAILDQIEQYIGYTTFVWVFDLLIMFGIMFTLVLVSSWLCSNLFTKKAKNVWTWCLVPGQAIVIILNLFVIPWLLLSLSSTVQTGGALAAGAGNIAAVAMPFIQDGNFTGFEGLDFDEILSRLDRADYWFNIAQGNYGGLNSLRFFKILEAISGPYGIVVSMFNATISAGFELLAALSPLAHGMFDNSNSTGVQVDGFYYQYNKFMKVYDKFPLMFNMSMGNSTKPSETDLSNAENDVNGIIVDIDYLLNEHIVDVMDHILAAEAILLTIDPDDLRNIGGNAKVEEVLNQVADQLDMVMNYTTEYKALIPVATDLLFESPHLLRSVFQMLVGNVRLLMGYQFGVSQTYFDNATDELAPVNAIFSDARRNEVLATGSATALGFFDFINDVLDLIMPVIGLEGGIAGTLDNVIKAIDEYVDPISEQCTLPSVNWTAVFDYMNTAIENSDIGVANATTASNVIDLISTRSNTTHYGIMSDPANLMINALTTAFQPQEFALILNNMTRAINATFGATYHITYNNEPEVPIQLTIASLNIDDAIAIADANNGTPIGSLKGILETFKTAIDDIIAIITPYIGGPFDVNMAIPQVETSMETLWTQIHNIVDDGLPP